MLPGVRSTKMPLMRLLFTCQQLKPAWQAQVSFLVSFTPFSPFGLTKPVCPVQAYSGCDLRGSICSFNPKRSNTKIAEVVASPPSDCHTLLSERLEQATEVDDN